VPKLTIDGNAVEVADGTTVIQAAAQIGITVPHYCWHPGLTVAGNCRMCLVEIEKMPKLSIACSTQVAEGMIVRTTVDRVREARDAVMEFLLINHPLDCPICDQAGECRLQQYSFKYGPGGSRFLEEKVHKPKNVDIRHIVFAGTILCTRCVGSATWSRRPAADDGGRGDRMTSETFRASASAGHIKLQTPRPHHPSGHHPQGSTLRQPVPQGRALGQHLVRARLQRDRWRLGRPDPPDDAAREPRGEPLVDVR
jgi:hypothetical protein